MYLAEKRKNGRRQYLIRESCLEGDKRFFRDLHDLGENPNEFIVYPGGNGFHFQEDLLEALARQGVARPERELEEILFPFLPPGIQRVVQRMTHAGRKKKPCLSPDAMARAQDRLHLFDRRRLFMLRFGRMDSPAVLGRPHKFLNVLVEMCRDERENHFRVLETRLRPREIKQYVYQTLDLGRFFPGDFARIFPQGLPGEKLDEVLLEELCRLTRDEDFLDSPAAPGSLSEYLTRYLFFWFDHEFGEKPAVGGVFEEFIRPQAQYRPPPPPPAPRFSREKALAIFEYTESEWRIASPRDVLRRYRKLAIKCHPDQGGRAEDFIELNQAHECLVREK
ncbi:MAG: J domain-containing protein [Pseudomonadota bacterium]